MGLLDLFNQWLVERGSAVVQEKHIALFRDQLLAADKKIASLSEEISILTAENSALNTENINLQNKQLKLNATVDHLTNKIHELNNPTHANLLDKEQILILQCLVSLPRDNALPIESIMSVCHLSEQAAHYHLQCLEDESMIEHHVINNISHWAIDHDGLGYLNEHKLLP
jgi:signal transduction histidine kinase